MFIEENFYDWEGDLPTLETIFKKATGYDLIIKIQSKNRYTLVVPHIGYELHWNKWDESAKDFAVRLTEHFNEWDLETKFEDLSKFVKDQEREQKILDILKEFQ